jgi:thiamine-monophosphate kinase
MDLSDGLADGVRQIAEAMASASSSTRARCPSTRTHAPGSMPGDDDALARAITGGDDYELVFTSSRRANGRLRAASRGADVAVTRIGICTEAHNLILRRSSDGPPTDEAIPSGYTHFR